MTPSSRRKLGLAFILIPPISFTVSLVLWPIMNFVFVMSMNANMPETGLPLLMRMVNIGLGLIGVLGLIGLFTAVPIGLYLFFSTPKEGAVPPQPPVTPPQA